MDPKWDLRVKSFLKSLIPFSFQLFSKKKRNLSFIIFRIFSFKIINAKFALYLFCIFILYIALILIKYINLILYALIDFFFYLFYCANSDLNLLNFVNLNILIKNSQEIFAVCFFHFHIA